MDEAESERRRKAAARTKSWREANPGKVVAYQKRSVELNRIWRKANPEKVAVQQSNAAARRKPNPEAAAAWRRANREKAAASSRAWYVANSGHVSARMKVWNGLNRDKRCAARARYRALKLQAAPPWVDQDELRKIYELAAWLGWHVDHIHPLKGKNFSGLHVPWNLQVLAPKENMRKSNKLLPEFVS